jgi:2,4-dienoyl-CoA reductase-like NADH-dependent reductase (Old Yellow Enzyme family)
VTPEGRISPYDLGIWSDDHIEYLSQITHFMSKQGAVPGMQLAHAGRKGSTARPWEGGSKVAESEGGWQVVAPSAVAFKDDYPMPASLSEPEIQEVIQAFAAASKRALAANFKILEIHSAHGYLLHEFLSPFSNFRQDNYGGSFENRIRLLLEVIDAVRAVWLDEYPLFVRISATDWQEEGWTIADSVLLCKQLKDRGVDIVDCSSGGNLLSVHIPTGPGYQTAFAQEIRREAKIATAAVGMIVSASQADHIVRTGQADMVLLARGMLNDPYFPLHAAKELKQEIQWPVQYLRV